MHESPFERVLAITRDILRVQHLEPALESIARAVRDLYSFKYVTIVAASTSGGDMTRRVMLGWTEDLTKGHLFEAVPRDAVLEIFKPQFEVVKNAFFIPAESETEWERSIYSGDLDRDSPREGVDRWHERDTLAFVLSDRDGEMLAYVSVDGPADGKIPTLETMNSLQLFVNLTGLALSNAQAHAAEVERRKLLENNQAQLRHEAMHDALTGLPNRQFFAERLANTLELARAQVDLIYAVLFIDLDEFKSINDSLGHGAGDQLLNAVAKRMSATLGDRDFVARLGGDEFAILVCARRTVGEVEAVAKAIQDVLVQPMEIESCTVYNTASIGIAIMHPDDERIHEVLRNADTAMYHAKSLGRARHAFFDDHMHLEAARRLTLTSDLRMAIEREQLTVVYQPIMSLADRKLVGFEALVRWRNPATGDVLPSEFIPLAEDVGLVVRIGRFVFVEACRRLAEWRERSPASDFRMHVNLSVQEVLQPDIDDFVAHNLQRFDLSPHDVTVELTESAIMRSGSAATSALARLRSTGVKLCIDDFGTGYSSLRYLHEFPVDSFKIDRSFVESADGVLGSPPIVRMMVQLAKLYEIDIVAEGVETALQAHSLLELECSYAQGYYFHRPMSADAVNALIDETLGVTV